MSAVGVGLTLLVGLVTAIVWLSKSRKKQVKAEIQVDALMKAQEVRSEADVIMAEPVADESAWLDAAARRLRDDSN